jgi:hypothetical protein
MTRSVSQAAAVALGAAAFISLSPLSVAFADPSADSAPTSSAPARVPTPTPTPPTTAAAPSLSEPSPTPGWAEAGPNGGAVGQHPGARHPTHRYASRGNRYDGNPVRTAATGVAGGVADLGSIAAYPFYCFPNYGSCSVKVPYRF